MGYSKREMEMVVVVVVVTAAVMGVGAEAAISCGTVDGKLSPCVSYTQGKTSAPSSACCNGVTSLYSLTKSSRPDRITACNCIKTLAATLGSSLNQANVQALPGKCGVNLGYSIGASTNCAGIP